MDQVNALSDIVIDLNQQLANALAAVAILEEHQAPEQVIKQVKRYVNYDKTNLAMTQQQLNAAITIAKQSEIPAGSMD